MTWRMLFAGLLILVGLVGALHVAIHNDPPTVPQDRRILTSPATGEYLHILVVGTSLTARYSWPDALAQRLHADFAIPVEISRVTRPGETSAWGMKQVDAIIGKSPDVVLVEFAINDADLRHWLSLANSVENHTYLISGIREELPSAKIILMTMNPAFGLRRLLRPRLGSYYEAYSDLARNANVGLVDLYPRWLGIDGLRSLIPDGVHPTDTAANEVIVPVLARYLKDFVGHD